MTWPQALYLSSHAAPAPGRLLQHVAPALVRARLITSPSPLFDANIFYPEPRTLALSDAMLVEGIAGAPLLWLA